MFDSMFPSHWTTLRKLMWLKLKGASAVWSTITGNPVSFTAKAAPLRQLEVAFSPVQNLNGYDAPWPAGGGANKWDEEWELGYWANGEKASANTNIRSKNKIPVSPNTAYYLKIPSNFYYTYYDADGVFLPVEGYDGVGRLVKSLSGAITTPDGAYYMTFNMGSAYGTSYNHDISINYPSSVTTYSPYSNECPISGWSSLTVYHSGADTSDPQTISISLGSTVYSGWVDVVMGVVTVDRAMYTATDDGEWRFDVAGGSYNYVYYRAITMGTDAAKIVCNIAPVVNNMSALGVTRSGGGFIQLYCNDIGIESLADWRTYIRNNTVQFVYPLATPTTIQLTPQEVQSLAGDNTMWTDAQNLEVTYRSN